MSKIVGEDVWISPRRVLWAALWKGFKNIVIVGEDEDGNIEVFGTAGGKKSNSMMTKAIRYIKNG